MGGGSRPGRDRARNHGGQKHRSAAKLLGVPSLSLTHIANAQPPKLNGRRYWRSLDELAETPQFTEWRHREFPEGASQMLSSTSRRTLLKLMAASLGLAGLAACSR
ncbi:MAG: TAT-variant-translocated molybdopterin oxidoreductase, partial [bacterium]|nr:TAT-variant-translocated molybdopterin oxidoreductase [bacterium]